MCLSKLHIHNIVFAKRVKRPGKNILSHWFKKKWLYGVFGQIKPDELNGDFAYLKTVRNAIGYFRDNRPEKYL